MDPSEAVIGRHERCQMTLSIDVARKLGDVFGGTVDSLVSERELPELLLDAQARRTGTASQAPSRVSKRPL